MASARLHLIGGGEVDVAEDSQTAAEKLWGAAAGSPGYASMQTASGGAVLVNPAAVSHVTDSPDYVEARIRSH